MKAALQSMMRWLSRGRFPDKHLGICPAVGEPLQKMAEAFWRVFDLVDQTWEQRVPLLPGP
jgi:hypothetical protein